MSKKDHLEPPCLQRWDTLNHYLNNTSDLRKLEHLREQEQKGRNRHTFVLRIQSRINRVRANVELEKIKGSHQDG